MYKSARVTEKWAWLSKVGGANDRKKKITCLIISILYMTETRTTRFQLARFFLFP